MPPGSVGLTVFLRYLEMCPHYAFLKYDSFLMTLEYFASIQWRMVWILCMFIFMRLQLNVLTLENVILCDTEYKWSFFFYSQCDNLSCFVRQGAEDLAQWDKACLASTWLWAHSSSIPEKKVLPPSLVTVLGDERWQCFLTPTVKFFTIFMVK